MQFMKENVNFFIKQNTCTHVGVMQTENIAVNCPTETKINHCYCPYCMLYFE